MNAALDTRNALLAGFLAHAARASQTVALRADGADVTYAALLAATARHAAALDALGVACDDVVAIDADRTPDTIALMLAILASGAAYLPLDAQQGAARLAAMLADAAPRLVVGDAAAGVRLPDGCRRVPRAQLQSTQTVLALRRSGALAYVLFTSGSTGAPKGVAMRTGAVAALLDWHLRHPRLGRPARTLQFAPLGFDVSFQEIFSTLASGGTLVLASAAERRDPWALLALLGRERIERAFLPAVALHALAEAAGAHGAEIPVALRDVVTAGEQLRITPAVRALFRALPGAVLHNHYGPTETHVVSAHELDGDPEAWPELPPIGQPLPHAELRIAVGEPSLQPSALSPQPSHQEGELLIGGRCLAAGYIGRPDLTAQRFIALDGERWYRSGDLARCDVRGDWHYLGRVDDQFKIAGYRVEPAEIEAVLCRHADVAQAAVVASPGASGHRLVAHVVAKDAQRTPSSQRLARHCAAALPEYLVPQAFEFHALLPTTASGKVDRRALAAASTADALEWARGASPEAQLRRLWEQLLGIDAVDVEANLFDLGARSLTVVRALTELRRHGYLLSVAQVYEHPSIAAQAALLAAAPPSGPARRVRDGARRERQQAAFARFGAGSARR